MSTLPGVASKGEKSKPKFQSLDINSLYRVSRGENPEKQQAKSTFTYKHGMQSLGKVPNARRAPANLPSLKSEHSGSDASVPLVPPGGPGWGKQDSVSGAPTTPTATTPTSAPTNPPTPQLSAHQAAIALPVTTTILPPSSSANTTPNTNNPIINHHPNPSIPSNTLQKQQSNSSIASLANTDNKSWSAVMSGQEPIIHPPMYQSQQFQNEFPSLSTGGDSAAGGTNQPNASATTPHHPYTPGLSLRPQTEGSWIQGGSKVGELGGAPPPLSNAAPPQLPAQLPQQLCMVMPNFMYKGNFQTNMAGQTPTGSNINNSIGGQPINHNRSRNNERGMQQRGIIDNHDEITPRPIIKEEELRRMDELDKDMGWTCHDEIDYNQKLAFSDDETNDHHYQQQIQQQQQQQHYQNSKPRKEIRTSQSSDSKPEENAQKTWNQSPNPPQVNRQRGSDDEVWKQRRNQHTKNLELTVQRAKQRKEEEEKRFNEATKQGAAKKLMELEEKILSKRNRDDENSGTINPLVVPPKPIIPADNIPLPDFQRDKERDSRSRTPNEPNLDEKSSFRQLTQIEGKSFQAPRNLKSTSSGGAKNERNSRDRDREMRDQNGPSFSRHFQNQLPPRFQKQRNNSGSNQPYQESGGRWKQARDSTPERDSEEREYKRQSSEESGNRYEQRKSSNEHRSFDDSHDFRTDWAKDGPKEVAKKHYDDDWHDRKYERPQRPDSRDSRTSRHSSNRDSEPREHIGSWADCEMNTANFNEDKRNNQRDDRRVVPGPITKDRIEADDFKSEKRSLTQLKRGQLPDKKLDKDESKVIREEGEGKSVWADASNEENKFADVFEKGAKLMEQDLKKSSDTEREFKDKERTNTGRSSNVRNYSQNKNWNEYHRSSSSNWSLTSNQSSKQQQRRPGSHRREFHTDSEGSIDEDALKKAIKKVDKDDKNKEIKSENKPKFESTKTSQSHDKSFVPRGEPSRYGRGGSFRGGRGGLGKRIDGYGPPPSKSPFGHSTHDDKKDDESCDERAKQNQQALAAGITGRSKDAPSKSGNRSVTNKSEVRSHATKTSKNDDNPDSNSDNSDEKNGRKKNQPVRSGSAIQLGQNRGRINPPPPRLASNDKKPYLSNSVPRRENSSGTIQRPKKDDKVEVNDVLLKVEPDEVEEFKSSDLDGFQEVKSKKTVKKDDKTPPIAKPSSVKSEKDNSSSASSISSGVNPVKDGRKAKLVPGGAPMTQQQILSIPPLMGTPINPPPVLQPQVNKTQFERPRQKKLAPRFEKQRENNRLQKVQQMQQHQQNIVGVSGSGDVTVGGGNGSGSVDLSKVNQQQQNLNVYGVSGIKDGGNSVGTAVSPIGNAWDKSGLVGAQLRGLETDVLGGDAKIGLEQVASQSPNTDKLIVKSPSQLSEKAMLDGTTPPMNTIIFENTNYKSAAPGTRTTTPSANSTNRLPSTTSSVTVGSTGGVVSGGDLKPRSKLDEDALNFKIQSVKKMWENDHTTSATVVGASIVDDTTSFPTAFVSDPNSLDSNAFVTKNDVSDDVHHDAYNSSPNQAPSNSTTNVCKVKPTQQVSGGAGAAQAVLGSANQHQQMMSQSLMGNPLSPPPLPAVIGQPPQAYTTNQHLSYQTGMGGGNQYGMPAIPSPPSVMYNSTQQMQQTPGLYGAFQLDQASVLGGQAAAARSQYSQYYGLGQTGSSPYSTQSVYLQTQPHPPPPSAQPPPDLYQNLSNYRMTAAAAAAAATGPFGQNQQLNNPTTVLISSTSNSLMSASVKQSGQQISAIGTKAGGVGQAYQQQSQQSQQVYMYEPSLQANYLPNAGGVMQRGPSNQVQNNVVPGLQPSSSYYSGSTGQTGYFPQPGSSSLQSAQMQQHQGGYGLQGFGTHNQSHTNAGLQSFNSHFLSTPMQLAAAALNAQQQFRNQYIKGVSGQQMNDQSGRSQQLKSPSQEALCSVFNTGSQISSPKLRQNCKQPPPQPSPTAQHKYNMYQSVGNQQQTGNMQRYPAPIQRPVNFQQNIGSMQQNNSNNSSNNQNKHRANSSNKPPPRQYYNNMQCNSISSSQNEKMEDAKLSDVATLSATNSSVANKIVIGASSATNSAELAKDSISSIEDASTLKD